MVGYAEKADLVFTPGTGFNYSNLGYNILAYIVERVSGKSFDVVLKENILDPAGMHNTRQFNNDRIEKKLVTGYEYKLLYGYENAVMFDHTYTVGPGGMISTVEDLYRWDQALYSNELLGSDLSAKMFTPYSTGKYGYGWFINKRKITEGGDSYIDPAFAPDIGQQIISFMYGEKINLPKKSIARHIAALVGNNGIDSAIAEYYRIIKSDSGNYLTGEPELNKLGIELYFKYKMTNDALKIFEVTMLQFPGSYNTFDSYAYELMQKEDYSNAIKYYKEGLEVVFSGLTANAK